MDQLNAIQSDLKSNQKLHLRLFICCNRGLTSGFLFHIFRSPFFLHFHSFTSIKTTLYCITKIKKNLKKHCFLLSIAECLPCISLEINCWNFSFPVLFCWWGILWYIQRQEQNSPPKSSNLLITHSFWRDSLQKKN